MKKKLIPLFLIGAILLSGCGAKSTAYYGNSAAIAEDSCYAEAPSMMESAKGTESGGVEALPQNRKWVINMDISAETEQLDETMDKVNARISELGGYVEGLNSNNGSITSSRQYRSVSMTVRIPAERVDEFVQTLDGVTNVVSSSRNVTDITLTYTDTESRLAALKAEEARLLELMGQAENMSDLLVIEKRLTEVRYQLESYTSQLRKYDNQVDYATVSLYINEVQRYTPAAKQSFWQRTATGFVQSLEDLGDTIVNLMEWFIVDLPYLVILALLGWGGVKLVGKHRRKKAAKKAEKEKSAD